MKKKKSLIIIAGYFAIIVFTVAAILISGKTYTVYLQNPYNSDMVTIDYSEKGIVENTELKHTANDTVSKFKSLKKGKTKVTATVYDKSDVRNKTTVCYDAEVLPMSIRKTPIFCFQQPITTFFAAVCSQQKRE